jgi:hypothetical protein
VEGEAMKDHRYLEMMVLIMRWLFAPAMDPVVESPRERWLRDYRNARITRGHSGTAADAVYLGTQTTITTIDEARRVPDDVIDRVFDDNDELMRRLAER